MSHLLKPLTIGGVTLENNLILAPMAGVTCHFVCCAVVRERRLPGWRW